MSIWSDHAVKELQEKVAWLEKENADIKQKLAALEDARSSPTRLGLNGTRKPS